MKARETRTPRGTTFPVAGRSGRWHVAAVRGPEGREEGSAARRRTVADCVTAPVHAGPLDGAAHVGEAAGEDGRIVRIGVFPDGRARFRATTCASLIAYAEVACEAIEAGVPADALDAGVLRGRVLGVHPSHLERAALVAAAVRAALAPEDS